MPELMKLLSTKSMMRYLPPNGTAGLARSFVSGYSRVPFPPASTIPNTRMRIGFRLKPYCSSKLQIWQAIFPADDPRPPVYNRSMSQIQFQTPAVIGTGLMGPGIALPLALGGLRATV